MKLEDETIPRIGTKGRGGKTLTQITGTLQPPSANLFHLLQADRIQSSSLGLQQIWLCSLGINLPIIFSICLIRLV